MTRRFKRNLSFVVSVMLLSACVSVPMMNLYYRLFLKPTMRFFNDQAFLGGGTDKGTAWLDAQSRAAALTLTSHDQSSEIFLSAGPQGMIQMRTARGETNIATLTARPNQQPVLTLFDARTGQAAVQITIDEQGAPKVVQNPTTTPTP